MADLRLGWRRRLPVLGTAGRFGSTAEGKETTGQAVNIFVWSAIISILLIALAVRLYNVGWDENTHLHPDERFLSLVSNDIDLPSSIGEYFNTRESPLNPHNQTGSTFVYGTFPLFLTKFIASALGHDNYDELVLVGRHLSALFDAGSVLFAFLIGRRLYGAYAGHLGAAFLALAPLPIQHSHFFVVDPFLTFFLAATLYFSIRIVQEGRWPDYALAGLVLGLGTASKLTAVAFLPVVALAAGWRMWPALSTALFSKSGSASPEPDLSPIRQAWLGLLLAVFVAFLAFRIAQPYAFESPKLSNLAFWTIRMEERFVSQQKQQNQLLSGEAGFPPSVQWIDRASYLYPLQQMVTWGMGPVFGLMGWGTAAYAAYRLVRRREGRHLLPLFALAVYFGFMGGQFSLYLRYFLPLYFILAVFAGFGLIEIIRWAQELGRKRGRAWIPRAAYAFAGLALGLSALWGVVYLSIYTQPATRVEASRWLYDNLPVGSIIAAEHWDDIVPMRLPDTPDKQFQILQLPMYETDTPQKVEKLISDLDKARYIVLSSNRLLVSIPRNQVNYPISTRYYDLLLKEELGFSLLRSFTSYPGLLGIDFPDHETEESWSSYDHPRVLVFEKNADYSRQELEALLGGGPFAEASLTPAQAERNGLLLTAADREKQRASGTWDEVFSEGGFADRYPALFWLLTLEAAALAVTPLAFVLFRRLPDRGYLLAKPLGLLLLAYPVWLIVSLKLVDFERSTVFWVLIALLALGAWLASRHNTELGQFIRTRWRLLLFCEALFLLAFLLFYELRLLNPDLWHAYRGGEKPMDTAYFTAITRSTTLPPYDPWFAGGYINYYYLGHFFSATLTKLTGIVPEMAFNLAIPTFFAMTAAAAFSVSYNLAEATRNLLRRIPGRRRLPPWSTVAAGAAGALFVCLLGNLDGFGQAAERLSVVSPWQVDLPLPLIPAAINSLGGLYAVAFDGAELAPFDYWRPSRMLPPTISITEFPYFSFLFADLHAHVMAIPFGILTVGASLGLALARPGDSGRLREWLIVVLLGLAVGSLRWLNSWDYPPFLLLSLAAVVIGERQGEGGLSAAALRLAGKAGLLIGLSFLFYWPFLSNYHQAYTGLHATPETTPLHQYLAHFGLFAAIIAGWLLFQLLRSLRRTPVATVAAAGRLGGQRGLAWAYARLSLTDQVWLSAVIAVTGLLIVAVLIETLNGLTVIAAMLPVLLVVAYLAMREFRARRPDGGIRLFVLAMLGLAFGLTLGVDLVTLNGDINRMNTVFKFYLHIWILLGLASAFALWYLVFVVVAVPARSKEGKTIASKFGWAPRFAWLTAVGALVLGAAIYPLAATPERVDDRFADLPRTLDGMAYMPNAVYPDPKGAPIALGPDYDGIQWLRHNVEGTPAILEGRAPIYRWGARFAIYTGLPTVLGWDWHQAQQRGEFTFMVDERARKVDRFYTDPDTKQALDLLRQYDVRYVILGQVERLYYPQQGLAKIEAGLDGTLEVAYKNAALTIYRVNAGRLTAVLGPGVSEASNSSP